MGVHYICVMGKRCLKYEKNFVYFALSCPVILVPILSVVGTFLATGVFSDIQRNQYYWNYNDYCYYDVTLHQLVFSFLIIMSLCSCQLCICCVYLKYRESSWRKQQQQHHPNGVVENAAVDERGFLISQAQSLPPDYSVVIDRDAPNDARIEQTRFQ